MENTENVFLESPDKRKKANERSEHKKEEKHMMRPLLKKGNSTSPEKTLINETLVTQKHDQISDARILHEMVGDSRL